MQNFKNINEFIKYCKDVQSDENDLFLLSGLASQLTEDELLDDMFECIKTYYIYLVECIRQERYEDCMQIIAGKNAEIKWYITLSQALHHENKEDILAMDVYLNDKFLGQ
jgi:hypothetical protein